MAAAVKLHRSVDSVKFHMLLAALTIAEIRAIFRTAWLLL
jgi:hypothetical protein